MNYLAHIYLSFDNKEIQIGNFIGDYVKGNNYKNYSEPIRAGILLHRKIDFFTDHHPLVKKCNAFFKNEYRLYASIISDMFFDHLLAKNWAKHHTNSLKTFTNAFHFNLIKHYRGLPPNVKRIVPFLIQNNRLYNYKSIEGIEKPLQIMSTYSSLTNKTIQAIQAFKSNEKEFTALFELFFEEIKSYVKQEMEEIKKAVATTAL